MEELTLDMLREKRSLRQADVSRILNLSQAAVSKLEFRTDSYVSSVRKYVEALGGKLEIHAVFGDERVMIRGLDGDDTITQLRALLNQRCRLSSLEPDKYNDFAVRLLDDDDRQITLEKLSSREYVRIPVRRVLEVLPAVPPDDLPTLVLRGRVVWNDSLQRWRYED
jgi:transcriptional regulator with XRE-family HTH domain